MLHNIWIATDLHLFNRDEDNRHPHRSKQEMNQIADNYGNMIQEDDLFIFLGDLYDPGIVDASEIANYINNIKGYKIMCRGNHDTESYEFYRELGFDDVCDVLRIHNLIFSHKPVKVAPDELNIHGHLHTEKLSTLGYQYINAYASNYNDGYQPVLLDDLIDSALVQNTDQINPLDKVDEKFEEFTSNRASVTYRNVRDLSDQFSLSPIDESTTKKDSQKLNLFFVSEHGDYDETILQPRVPNNYMTQNGFEDNATPRVSFSTSIDGCLMGLSQNITDKVFYVYQPVGKYKKHKVITPTEKQVPDVKITKERWICEPVELTCIGKIKAIDENGPKDDGIPYRYGPNKEHEARLYHWGYRWLEKFNESISPSIVSLSAEVEEDEEKTPLDEILFPDVDSTQYWEADDGSLEKKANPERFSDSRPTHKMVGKNDVAADGQSTMDEDVNYLVPKHPEMIIKTQYLDKDKVTPKTISILAKDLFGERAMIHPEILDQQKLATMKTVNELIDYFNSMSIFVDGSATRSPNGIHINTPNFVVGAFLFANRKKHTDAIAEADLDVLLPSRLSDAKAFKEYITNSVEALNELEGIICSMICANLAMIRISINDVIDQLMTPGGKKSIIKRAKEYIDDHADEFVTKFNDGTVLYDYKKLGIDCEVFISDLMYNGSEFKKINRPSRFLVRTAIYDKILVVHGATEQLDHGKYKWTIEPITIYGKQYTDLDEVIRVFKTTHAGRILVISCNTDGVVPDNALYDIVDYASGEVIFESTTSLVSQNGSPKSVLKSIQKHAEKRINELNKIESKVLSEIDSFDMIIVPDEFSYVEIDGTPATAKLITKQIPDDIKKYKKLCGTTTDKLFKFYKEFMFVIYQFTKRLLQTSLVESGYHWDMNDTVVVEDFLFHEDSSNYQSQSIIDNPTANYQYETLEECIHDAALYAEASGSSMYAFNISGGVIDKIQAAVNEDAYGWLSSHNIEDHPLIKRINDIHSAPSVKSFESDIPEVFFTKEITAGSLNKIFSLIYMPGDLPNGWKNMVKISTGEPGGHNYLKPELIGDLIKRINGAICDTVTAYDGNRNTKEKQLKTMKDHGFTDIGEVDVLDGDGELVVPVKDGLILKESLAGSHIMDYDFHLILTHFKGHAMAGFGGAIKNVAIGCSSRRGKSLIHTYGSTADMTIGFGDEYDQQSFLKAMVDAAKSYVDLMKIRGPILYINIANNLSVDCDCSDHPADPTMDDIGIFASWDPVAVDQACIDAVYHAKDSHDLVERIESKDGTDILLYAEESGMGSRSYELINIDLVNENADGSLSLTETKEYNRTDNIGPIEGYPYVSSIWTADAEGSIYINPDYEHINEAAIKVNDITRIVALNNELNDYQYGLSRNNQKIKKQNTTSEDYDKYYRVATPTQFVKQNGGICWDFATYEAFVFKKQFPNIKFKTYYIVFDTAPHYPTHTFLVFEKDMKFYYFESSLKRIQGIWVANSVSDIFNFVLHSMDQYRPKDYKASLLKYKYAIFEYNALHPDIPGSTTVEFMNLMEEIGQEIPHVYNSKYDVKPYIDTDDLTVRKTKTKNENDTVSSEAVKLDFYLNKEHIAEASISAVDTGKGFLYDLEVFKKYRGQGNGTKVMQYILSHYKVSDLSVDANNTPAVKLYTKFGFRRKKSFYDKTQKKTFDWYQREPVLLDEAASKEYLRTDNIHAMSREEEKTVAEKYGLRAVGQEVPAEEEKRRQTPEERYAERNKKRQEALKKARKVKKRKAFARKVKSHLPFVNNEEVELIRESESAVDSSDVDIPDGVEHSPLYGEKKDFFYNYDYPKSVNAYAERLKLEESTVYHGSPYKLTKLKPTSVYKGENALFASPNYTFALCYAGKHWTDQEINQCIVNGYVVLTELKNGIFDKVFDCSGYIYEFDSDDFIPIDDGTYEMYRVADIKPAKTHRIANVYQALVDAGVELRRYPAVPPSMNEAVSKPKHEEDPLTKKELAQYGIRDLRTFQRWLKNNVKYKNMTTLMSPREVLEQKHGSCHDQVVLELAVLKALGYSPSAYFVLEHDNKPTNSQGGETHSYVVVKDGGKLYWLENAWSNHVGLNEVTNPKFIIQAHQERAWGDSNKFPELEVVHFAGQYGDSLQQLVDHCFNDKQEIDKPKKKESVVETGTPIWETYQFELEEPIQFLDRMDEAASNSSKSHVYTEPLYRITYNDIGIYEAYKKACSFDEWRSFINSDAATWLDVPKIYNKDINHTSYFTKRGYELFQKNTYPVIIQKLNKRNIKVDQVVLDVKPVYEDLYQVVVPNSVNESSIQDSYQFELLDKSVHFYDKIDEAASYQAKGKLYPVYVVLVHSGTGVSKAIKAISHSEYSHASICFDSSLDKMYSFARKDPRNPFIGGFRYESIGKGFYDQKEIPYAVYVVPCTESQIKKMKKRLNYFIQNQEKFTFDFTGLVTNYLGIVNNPAHRWFCSRFVADILNAGAPKNNPYVAEPSLQDPDDFKDTDWAIYVDSGENLMKYDRKKVDRKTNQIIRKEMLRRMAVNESAIFDLDAFNPFIESTLNYQFAMMDESVVDSFVAYLKSFKLKFDKDGNLIIRRREYDQLDQHFRASLRMIKAAEKAGDTGTVKDELCKINYMINLIQTQYMNQKTTDKNRKIKKEMEDLRSVMYNAFHQHLKWVVQIDPQFNFNSYYNSSKYGKDIVVDKKILTAAGKTIVTTLL